MFKCRLLLFAALWVLLTACRGETPLNTAAPTSILASAPSPTPRAGCTVISLPPTPGPTERSLFPAVSADDWVIGPVAAEVTIVEYSDFQ